MDWLDLLAARRTLKSLLHHHSSKASIHQSSAFFVSFHLFIYLFLLYNNVLLLPYINMNPPWVYMSSPSWTPLPPPSPSHSSGSSQCTGPEHRVLCIKSGLVIYFIFGNINVSMLFSQIITPSPSPRVQKSILYVCVSFAVSHVVSSLPSF